MVMGAAPGVRWRLIPKNLPVLHIVIVPGRFSGSASASMSVPTGDVDQWIFGLTEAGQLSIFWHELRRWCGASLRSFNREHCLTRVGVTLLLCVVSS